MEKEDNTGEKEEGMDWGVELEGRNGVKDSCGGAAIGLKSSKSLDGNDYISEDGGKLARLVVGR